MTDTLENHKGTVSISGSKITNLCFADNIDGLASKEEEFENLVKILETTSTAYGMEISSERTKITANKADGFIKNIKVQAEPGNAKEKKERKFLGQTMLLC